MRILYLLILPNLLLSYACQEAPVEQKAEPVQASSSFDVEGHRGCRGHFPENTIEGFIKAIDMGVNTLEMDAVISSDAKVLLSHEPWLSHSFCLTADGDTISKEGERDYNLYQMSYDSISQCDCGSKFHPGFPDQEHKVVSKPLLSAVIDSVETYITANNLAPVQYNIETKCRPEGDNIYHPEPARFVDLLMAEIQEGGIEEKAIIQSFDKRTLKEVHQRYPDIRLALLIGDTLAPAKHLEILGFIPEIYSPNHRLVDEDLVEYTKQQQMQLIPWTVNEKERIQEMIDLGVDGIISDYPDRVIAQLQTNR